MMKMTKPQLIEAIKARGEEPPSQWSRVELRDRLVSLMEAAGEEVGGNKKTDLRQWITDLKQVQSQEGQPPGVLRDTVENDVDRNETVPVLQRQALKVTYEVSIPNAMDPVGFGKWASLTYGQLLREQPSYTKWVQETMLEGGNTCDYRLIRLATWLMNQTIDEEAEETEVNIPKPIPETVAGQQGSMTRPAAKVMQVHIEPKAKAIKPGKGYAKEASAARGSHAAASSQDASPAVTAEQFKIMMETMATMKEEIQQLRESKNPEEPRRKKNTETETDTEKSTEKSFQMLLDP